MSDILQQLVAGAFRDVQTIRYAELGSSTIIVFDHLITLDQEIELIWKSGWSVGKTLFLINRYYTLAVVIFNNYSSRWFQWQGVTGVFAFIVGELILQLRLYALYFLDKRVLALMAFVFFGAVVSASTLMGIFLSQITATSHIIPGLSFCVPLNIPTHFFAWWIPILISETLLCGLALYRGFQSYYSQNTIFQSGRDLIEILIRDSVLYFLVLFGVYLCNTIIFILGDQAQLESAIGYSVAMSCVMGNRLCLNVRGMLYDDEDILPRNSGALPTHPTRPSQARVETLQLRSNHAPVRHPSHRSMIIRVGHDEHTGSGSDRLSEFEMVELRGMKAAKIVD
ncbi:hypothetical protein K474DRAFT_1712275 [Panus rudis PR-1116 ss-1]|nr:hypothetical protein K474DRAFT_1712275 [Panus rudis PR-1116 ss-1]